MEAVIKQSSFNLQRQSFLGVWSQQTLHLTKIAIIGLGGGGSHVAQQLAHVGVGRFVVLDPDLIEDTNLNRLVGGTTADVRQSLAKVLIAKRVIEAVNPEAQVVVSQTSWQEQSDLLQDCDVIFGCIDSLIGRHELEAFARRCMIPLIDIGMDVHQLNSGFMITGQVALSIPDMPCLRCMGLLTEADMKEEAEKYGMAGSRPQVIWPNAILASTAVGYFMQLTTPWENTSNVSLLLEYDGNKQTIQPSSKLPYLPHECPHYSGNGNVGDPFWAPQMSQDI